MEEENLTNEDRKIMLKNNRNILIEELFHQFIRVIIYASILLCMFFAPAYLFCKFIKIPIIDMLLIGGWSAFVINLFNGMENFDNKIFKYLQDHENFKDTWKEYSDAQRSLKQGLKGSVKLEND